MLLLSLKQLLPHRILSFLGKGGGGQEGAIFGGKLGCLLTWQPQTRPDWYQLISAGKLISAGRLLLHQ